MTVIFIAFLKIFLQQVWSVLGKCTRWPQISYKNIDRTLKNVCNFQGALKQYIQTNLSLFIFKLLNYFYFFYFQVFFENNIFFKNTNASYIVNYLPTKECMVFYLNKLKFVLCYMSSLVKICPLVSKKKMTM